MALIAKYHPILNKFEHQNVAKIMDSQRFELQNAAMPLAVSCFNMLRCKKQLMQENNINTKNSPKTISGP